MISSEGHILTIGSIKGGGGKSLLAVNTAIALARQGFRDVLLVDGDRGSDKSPGSATLFTEARAAALGPERLGYTCVSLHGRSIATQAAELRRKYSHIIIDCGGHDNPSVRAALTVTDRLLIPVPPRSVDEWAIQGMVERISGARTINPGFQAFIVINRGDVHGQDNRDTKALIRADYLTAPDDAAERASWMDPQITILDSVVCERKPFSNAFGAGRSILELEARPDNKKDASIRNGQAEILALHQELFEYHQDIGAIYNVRTG